MKNCNFDFITEKIQRLISNLYFTDDELADFGARTSTDISLLEEKRHTEFAKIERQKKRTREDLAYIRSNRLSLLKSGAYTPEGIVTEQDKLKAELDQLLENEKVSETAMVELMKEVTTLSELIKDVVPIYDFATPHEKETITRVIFSELFIAQDTLEYKVKNGFEPFTDRISAICDPVAWLSELYKDRKHIESNIKLLGGFSTNS